MYTLIGLIALAIAMITPAVTHSDQVAAMQRTAEPLAAEFEVQLTDRSGRSIDKTEWYFLRESNRIEAVRPNLQLAEVWERDGRGDLSLRRIFHTDRRVVEYRASDLRAMHISPAWSALGSVIDPRVLGQLKQSGTEKLPAGTATVYQGTVDKERIEIWWLDTASLPARIVRQQDDHQLILTLKGLHATPPADWPRVDQAAVQAYLVIDATDLSDMHYDPFVRKIERFDAETRAFGHVGHSHPH